MSKSEGERLLPSFIAREDGLRWFPHVCTANEMQAWGRTQTAVPCISTILHIHNSRITPCPWLSPCSFSSSFLLWQTQPWRKQKTPSGGCRDPSVQGISIIWESQDYGFSNIPWMSCTPGNPLDPQNSVSLVVPLQDVTSMPWMWEQILQRDAAFTPCQSKHRFFRSLSPVRGLYSSLKEILSLKSMQWQPRLISHPHAIFLNYVIRKILLTVVLNPLETWKFHFPCIYSSSLTTCCFFYSFLLLVETPSQCNSLLLHFDTNQNWDFCDLYVPMSRTIRVFISQKWGHCSYFISIPNQIELIVFFGVFKH